jgi:ferric-dicitrate binding protein FerR (iron transport regulator)
MEQTPLSALIARYINDELSEEEVTQLWESLDTDEARAQWEEAVAALLQEKKAHGLSDPVRMERVWKAIRPATREAPAYRRWLWAAAAALLGAMATSIYFFQQDGGKTTGQVAAVPHHQVKPGTDKAVLTLADGTQVTLDSTGNGALAMQGNIQVVQHSNGEITYTGSGAPGHEIQYNNLTIPRGGQFRITLSDGTKVWLNAASGIRYPAAFTGRDRVVELTGEAYFEVAQLPSKPFKVVVNNMEVQVLGTSFNIMAYGDEAVTKTTLLEGAVKIRAGSREMKLLPGQQAQLQQSGEITINDNVDVEEIVAWKNGYFQFNHEKTTGVMRQIARWYDVDISYHGNIPDREFGGKIARSSSIDEVIKVLELSRIHVKIENKKIIVMP